MQGPDEPLVQIAGLKTSKAGSTTAFSTDVRFVPDDGDELVLITFQPRLELPVSAEAGQGEKGGDTLRLVEVAGLSQELDHTTRLLERALETERKIRRDSLRLNEEYQSTNEELVTSKEELQSLNEELTVLNSQLQEALERQRTTSDDLKNVLYSTNVATLFLDRQLCIRFFTPATKTVFGVIASDIGRPLADLGAVGRARLLELRARLSDADVARAHEPREHGLPADLEVDALAGAAEVREADRHVERGVRRDGPGAGRGPRPPAVVPRHARVDRAGLRPGRRAGHPLRAATWPGAGAAQPGGPWSAAAGRRWPAGC